MPRSRLVRGLAAAILSTALASAAGWWVLTRRPDSATLLLLDTTEEVRELLAARHARGEIPMPGLDALGRALPVLMAAEVTREVAGRYYPALGQSGLAYHPRILLRRPPHLSVWQRFPEHPDGGWTVRTNDMGLREDQDVRRQRPDLRILVIGDSHTEGACANDESFANRLEALYTARRPGQAVDVLNVGCGSYDPFNYLVALDVYGDLEPDALVMVLFGGNDFLGALGLRRYLFRGAPYRRRPYDRRELLGGDERAVNLLGQELDQALHLLNNPEEEDVALAVTCAITAELQRQCTERGIAFVAVYLPAPSRAQPRHFLADMTAALAKVGAGPEALESADRLGRGWLAFLEERSIAHLDLGPVFRGVPERLYWHTDLHLNLAGHRRVAKALEGVLEALLE